MDKLITFIKEKYPQNAIDISESLDLFLDTIDDLRKNVHKEIGRLAEKGEYEKITENMQYAKEIKNLEDKFEEIIEKLSIEEDKIEEIIEENEKTIPNYSKYEVDNNIEHNLYEDFTHKRPFAFMMFNEKINVKTWKELLLITCEKLYKKDINLFRDIINKKNFQGKKRKNFSTNADELREQSRLKIKDSNIWIETNLSGNGIRNLIIKLLKEYDIKINEFKVFFKADYSELKYHK